MPGNWKPSRFGRAAGHRRAPFLIGLALLAGPTVSATTSTAGATVGLQRAAFIENRGQVDPEVAFYASGGRTRVWLTVDGLVLELRDHARREAAPPGATHPRREREKRDLAIGRRYAMRLRFAGGRPDVRIEGRRQLPFLSHFFLGAERGGWSGVPAFEEVVYRDLWPGTDLVIRADADARLLYDIVSDGGSDAEAHRFVWEGATERASAGDAMDLLTPLGVVRHRWAGVADASGEISWKAHGAVAESAAAPETPGTVGATDGVEASSNAKIRMDLGWSGFLGGARDDAVYAVAVDADERPLLVGATRSADFPTTVGALDTTYDGSFDAVLTKLDAGGTTLLWSTFLGASGDDRAWAVRIDPTGRPVVAGVTDSSGFPTTPGAHDESPNGGYDAFVARLEADGSALVWSTVIGGSGREWDVSGVDLDAAGRPVLIGSTRSTDFPATPGALDTALDGTEDGFAAKLEADGSDLAFATYLGGSASDAAEDVAVDGSGAAIVVGRTASTDFPATAGAFQTSRAGTGSFEDGFVARLNPDGASLSFATYLGGNVRDRVFATALDDGGRILVTGSTESDNFPTTAGAFSRERAGFGDVFVTRLASDGASLDWSTYVGGASGDDGLALAADDLGRAVFAGATCSFDFPTAGSPFSDETIGPCEAFVARVDRTGSLLEYSTYLGSWRDESAFALALDNWDRPVVGGETFSTNFPTTAGAWDTDHNSPDDWYDGFATALLPVTFCVRVTGTTSPEITIERALRGQCPPESPGAQLADVIEGRLEELGPLDIGPVEQIACDSPEIIFDTDTVPAPGRGLFILARFAGGAYTDGGGATLVGDRIPESGDCP